MFQQKVGWGTIILTLIANSLKGLLLLALVAFLTGLIVMWLWNWIAVGVLGFDVPTLNWIQGWGLAMLCGILFKGGS